MGVVTTSQIQRELQAVEEYQFQEHAIDELEQLEYSNMFEEMPTLPTPEDETDNVDFADKYTALVESGLTHDEIMGRLKS